MALNSHFATVPSAEIQRSHFNRSHNRKQTFDSGYLVPIFVDEVLPGDTFDLKCKLFARMTTPIYPVMDNAYLMTHFWFVPNRLVWDNFENFIGQTTVTAANIDEQPTYIVPTISVTNASIGSIYDYYTVPPLVTNSFDVNALFFRAYNLIWNEWYRDENLQEPVSVPTGDGPDDMSTYTLLKRGKRHDYFTSALPFPQKGPGVMLPLGDVANVFSTGSTQYLNSNINMKMGPLTYYRGSNASASGVNNPSFYLQGNGLNTTNSLPVTVGNAGPATYALFATKDMVEENSDRGTGLYADLSSATAATINSLRMAFQIQKMYEKDARGGTRYTEILRSHFNVTSPDARLQRPEYLGGSVSRLIVNPVAQTASTDTTSPQGNLSAFALFNSNTHGFTKSFVEHGVIIGVCCVYADLSYQQGLNRMFSRSTRFDYYWPTLAHLGEQEVRNKEIYIQGTDDDNGVFGFQERYAEYRYYPSVVAGLFRSQAPQSLDSWHLAQDFDSLPQLNSEFIEENPPFERVLAVQDEPQFLLDSYFELHCARPIPLYGTPGLVDHF